MMYDHEKSDHAEMLCATFLRAFLARRRGHW
jgi:hypothetical protein